MGASRDLNWWGWGFADARPDAAAAAPGVLATLGFGSTAVQTPVALATVELPPPRLATPFSESTADRMRHAYGRSYLDTIRAFRGRFDHVPDAVAFAREETDIERVLEWAADHGAAVIPYGGGTSVCGGVEPAVPDRFNGTISLDVSQLDRVLAVDDVSRSARIQAGAPGPALESQLAEHGMTLRFFPQSFELSTLGGWIATRAGGHFATVWTHIDDLVESVRALTPAGRWQSRRLPGSGAGPSPDRMLLGSEGILGVITEAWVRVQPRPRFRASRAVRFPDFLQGAEAVRAVAQSGLHPAGCRLVDALEAQQTGIGDGVSSVLVLGFESTDHDVGDRLERALAICAAAGGAADDPRDGGGAVGAWREAFLAMPYLRDVLLQCGVLADTFETAITWERFPAFHASVIGATRAALGEPCRVSCRFTHVYPNGPAPYYTVLAPARRGEEIAQWHEMKAAAGDAIIAAGGTITHHHAVGRDHRPWYDRQRPDPFAAALRGAKAAVDPGGLLNPGVLIAA
ncbi:MAG TPA: FAD-binding oxidoreductase [Solirubrobacteraceae bacterium]|jgi:alkyldihydroxyacetonephosphate synthase|nr:FAD-binding oxidoreductase [Solirubrobacteraceae bacterium]